MGAELLVASAVLARACPPDWDAAVLAIERFRLVDAWQDTLDPLYEWEWWDDEERAAPPNPIGTVDALTYVREKYLSDLEALRWAIESQADPELATIELPSHIVYASGGFSWGQLPTELYNSILPTRRLPRA